MALLENLTLQKNLLNIFIRDFNIKEGDEAQWNTEKALFSYYVSGQTTFAT